MQFLTPVDLCYDTLCSRILVPWVPEFEELGENNKGIAILSKVSGEFKQGMYLKQNGFWVLALNYEDLCTILSDNSAMEVVVSLSSPTAIPATSKAYRNGYHVPGITEILPFPNVIWVVAAAPNSGSGTGTQELTDMFGTSLGNFVVV